MGDIELRWDPDLGVADFYLRDDDLATDEGLGTAVLMSVFIDRQADKSDVLPADDRDRRGWWGDQYAENDGDKIGSRRWLLYRSKLIPSILPVVETYDRESLAWMIEDQAVASFELDYEIMKGQLSTRITFHRNDGTTRTFRFGDAWDSELGSEV